MTIDELYERRRDLQLRGEALGKGDECWQRMGVAHRHLERIENGTYELTDGVEGEIIRCFEDVDRWLNAVGAT